jgi:hypothetical protein
MSKTRSFASLALGAAALGFAASPASAVVFTAIGDASGPFAIITITDGATPGSLQAAFSAGSGQTYDTGLDDVYYGVVNSSSLLVNNITLSGTGGPFGFENDGIGAGTPAGSGIYPGAGGCGTTASCTTPSAVDNSPNGYGGPISSFLVVDVNNGSVLFTGGLAPGATTYFALEATVDNVSVTGVNTATPLPAALPLFAGGLGVMGLLARRRKLKAAQA